MAFIKKKGRNKEIITVGNNKYGKKVTLGYCWWEVGESTIGNSIDSPQKIKNHMIQQPNFWLYIPKKLKQDLKEISELPYLLYHYS